MAEVPGVRGSETIADAARGVRENRALYLSGPDLQAFLDVLEWATVLAENDEYRADRAADEVQATVEPKYGPLVKRVVKLAAMIGPSPEVPF